MCIAIFGSLPFIFSSIKFSFTNAFFESMSGITTTGSTIISDLQNIPKGILLWRAMLQWLGGIGIIVIAIAIFPILKIGGMQLLQTEFSSRIEKVLPRTTKIATAIGLIYVLLTIICGFFLYSTGLSFFDSVASVGPRKILRYALGAEILQCEN